MTETVKSENTKDTECNLNITNTMNGTEIGDEKSIQDKSPEATSHHTPNDDDDGFDKLLSAVGFGLWQLPVTILVVFVAMLLPVHLVGMPLLSPPLPFKCFTDPLQASHRNHSDNTTWFNDACFSVDGVATETVQDHINITLPTGVDATGMASCPYVQYDTSVFTASIFSKHHLMCEREKLGAYYQMVYNVGGILGTTVGGQVGDRFGRITVVKIGSIASCLGSVLVLLAPTYSLVLLGRFILGTASLSSLVAAWTMILESSPSRNRSLVGMMMGLPYSVFVIIFASISYCIRDWQILFLITSSPILILIPFSFFVDESPRWLLQCGKGERGLKIMEKAVTKNKTKLSEPLPIIIDEIMKANESYGKNEREEAKVSCQQYIRECGKELWQYLKSPGMRIILICLPVIWFIHSLIYLGLAINANNFTSTTPFLYVGLTGVMDGASILLITPLTTCLGRKAVVGGGLTLSGVLLLLDLAVPVDYYWLKWILVMTGFFLCAGSFQMNYVYAPELFPTAARNRGSAFVNMIGGIGYMCAPLITIRLARHFWWAANVIFGCSGIAASLLLPLLPETSNRPMPETLKDVDRRWRAMTKKQKKKAGVENTGFENDDNVE